MASLESLPADQRAVLSLVLQRGRSFDEIAGLLFIDRAAVRQRALAGFQALGPETSVDPLKRGLITDYLLGQLPPAIADRVYQSLADNPPERAWARVIAAEIAPLAVNPLPEIPAPPGSEAASTPPSSRRGGAILLGLIALAIIVVVVVLLATGGSSSKPKTPTKLGATPTATSATLTGTSDSSTSVTPLHQINLISPTGIKGRDGVADVVRANAKIGIVLVAEGLTPTAKNAYGVWLYNSQTGAGHFLGFYDHQVTDTGSTKGELEVETPELPANATQYNELLLTLETAENPTKPGTIVLQGTFAE